MEVRCLPLERAKSLAPNSCLWQADLNDRVRTLPAIVLEATDIDFDFDAGLQLNLQLVRGEFRIGEQSVPVEFALNWREDGSWQIRQLRWLSNQRLAQLPEGGPQHIANLCANLLKPVSIWSELEDDGRAHILLGAGRHPDNVRSRLWASHRSQVLKLPGPPWQSLWDRIKRRADYDEAFFVPGFTKEELTSAIEQLRLAFPADWVQARYREAGLQSMNGDFQTENTKYFPAYHLARAASGALCVDPGWKYLVEIGLSLEALRNFDGYIRLRNRVASSTGTQHHICMAAELLLRGHLRGLEPEAGVGAARDDLLVEINGRRYQIELKEFSSSSPVRQIQSELAQKARQIPPTPASPTIFHVVLLERSGVEPIRLEAFCDAVEGLIAGVPKNISAVVVGRRFLDSSGSRVRRDCLRSFLVPDARTPALEQDLLDLFPANFERLDHPLMGLSAPMHFTLNSLEQGAPEA